MTRRKRNSHRKAKPRHVRAARRVNFEGLPDESIPTSVWEREWRQRTKAGSVRLHPVIRLGEDGFGHTLDDLYRTDCEIGYGMDPYRVDDCLQAAIATAAQIPIEQVPDLRIGRRAYEGEDPDEISRDCWARIQRWARGRGLVLAFHEQVPLARTRWIGVCPDRSGSEPLGDHCLVMCHERVIFDPARSVRCPPGQAHMVWDSSDVAYGITLEPLEDA